MRSGFRPRDCDRTTESMEGSLLGFGPLWRGVGLQHKEGFYGYPVNRRSIKRPRSISRMFLTRSRKQGLRGATGARERSELRTDNREDRGNPNGCKF